MFDCLYDVLSEIQCELYSKCNKMCNHQDVLTNETSFCVLFGQQRSYHGCFLFESGSLTLTETSEACGAFDDDVLDSFGT